MPDIVILIGFISASLVILLSPGPGVVYVTARSLSQGRKAGLISALGLSAGAFVHVLAAIVGLSSILLASATAFTVVKFAGAAYLIYLGLRMIFSRQQETAEAAPPEPAPLSRLFADGVIVSILNPKIAIFFLAFLPQFIDPSGANPAVQILVLGAVYCTLSVITDGGYALLAANLREWAGERLRLKKASRMLNGGVFVALGIQTALAERPG